MEPLKIVKKTDPTPIPEWIHDLVAVILPHIDKTTRFVCLVQDPNMGEGKRTNEKAVTMGASGSLKNLVFETDGTYTDTNRHRYKDGTIWDRVVKDFKYIVLENAVRDGQGQDKIVSVCYVTDKTLLLALRQQVGLPGW